MPDRRVQVRELPDAPGIQPRARPVDTFVNPGRSNSLTRLADSLKRFQPSFQKFIEEKDAQQDEAAFQEAYAARLESEKSYKEAIKDGSITPGMSPHYRRGYRAAELRIKGREYRDQMIAEYMKSDVRGQDDPEVLSQWATEFHENFVSDQLSEFPEDEVIENFVPAVEGARNQLFQQHLETRVQAYENERWENFQREVLGQFDDFASGQGTKEELVEGLTALGQDMYDTDPSAGPQINEAIVDLATTQAMRQLDPSVLDAARNVKTGTGKLGDTAYAREQFAAAKQDIADEIEERREEALDAQAEQQEINIKAAVADRIAGDMSKGRGYNWYGQKRDVQLVNGDTVTVDTDDLKDEAVTRFMTTDAVVRDEAGEIDGQATLDRQIAFLSKNGNVTYDKWESMLEGGASAVSLATDLDEVDSENVQVGYALYKQLREKGAIGLLERHSDEKTRQFYNDMFFAETRFFAGEPDAQQKALNKAWQAQQLRRDPDWKSRLPYEESKAHARELRDMDEGWFGLWGEGEVNNMSGLVAKHEQFTKRYVELGVGPKAAAEQATKDVKDRYTVVNGWAMPKGSVINGENYSKLSDFVAQRYMKAYGGKSAAESPDDLVLAPVNVEGSAYQLIYKADGRPVEFGQRDDADGVPYGRFSTQQVQGVISRMRDEMVRGRVEREQAKSQEAGAESDIPDDAKALREGFRQMAPKGRKAGEHEGTSVKEHIDSFLESLPEADPNVMPGPGPASQRRVPTDSPGDLPKGTAGEGLKRNMPKDAEGLRRGWQESFN